ncbi:hypothetical protein L195_g016804 [Trifolium pratense]|uniref:Uncharacterized protein n=1 Tax=Trifolium pratense TaxID=57577 RepID=A0A2K3MSG0_TRIPR|nr:hypothetical protein L195_g016804 [Trifolium pratense]
MTAATCKVRPLLQKLSGSCPEFDLSGTIAKILEEHKGLKELLKDKSTQCPSSTTAVVICNSAQYGRLSVALLEIIGSKGAVKVNGKTWE